MPAYQMPQMPQLGQQSTSLEDLLQNADPKTLSQILGVGTSDDKAKLLEHQLAQAEALGGSHMMQGQTTATGSALAGGGDLLAHLGGIIGAHRAQSGLTDLMGQRQSATQSLLDLLRGKQSPTLAGGLVDQSAAVPSDMA